MLDNYFFEKPSNYSLLSDHIEDVLQTENFYIEKNLRDGHWYMKSKNEKYYNILSIDTNNMVKTFAKSLINSNFNSILISGLGLGILPFLCQKTTEIVDVVEIEKEVIDIVEKIGHLDNNVRVYNESIWLFTPKIKYDVILLDHWMSFAVPEEIERLKKKFEKYLNEYGFLTIPIYEQTLR